MGRLLKQPADTVNVDIPSESKLIDQWLCTGHDVIACRPDGTHSFCNSQTVNDLTQQCFNAADLPGYMET